MDKLGIIQSHNIVQATVGIFGKRFKQRIEILYKLGKEKIENMDKLGIIQGQTLFKQRFDFSGTEKIQTMHRLAITQGHKIVETTVKFSS